MTTRRDDAGTRTTAADGCAAFEAALPEYLEGTLTGEADGAARAHVVACESCRMLVRDLERIRTQAAALPVLHPSRDLWAGIEARIQTPARADAPPTRGRTMALSWFGRGWSTQALARAAVLVLATAGVTVIATRRWTAANVFASGVQPTTTAAVRPASPPTAAPTPAGTEPQTTPTAARPGAAVTTVKNDGHPARVAARTSEFIYDQQITALRRLVETRRGQMNPKTVAIIEKNLRVIDAAIAESKAALAKDPANGFLAEQLDATLDTKLELLRTVAMLPTRT